MKKIAAILFVLLALSSFAALAQQEESGQPPEVQGAGYTILKDTIGLRVDSEGRVTQIEDELIGIDNKNGIERFSKVVRLYDSDRQEVDIVVARTIMPDGKSIQVPLSHIKDTVYPGMEGSRLYQNLRVRTIEFSDLKEGCSIAYRMETRCKLPYPGGDFWETSFTQDYGDIRDTSFFVQIPRERKIKYVTPGHNGLVRPAESTSGNMKSLLWQFRNMKPVKTEVAMPPLQMVSSKIVISSFSSWDEVAAFFRELTGNHMKMNEDMKVKLQKLTAGMSPEEKVRSIFSWLHKEHEVVTVNLGQPGYGFNDTTEAFKEKIISSRDSALLLLTLLREAKIEASPVLLCSYSNGDIDRNLASVQEFDTILIRCTIDGKAVWLEPQNSEGGAGSLTSETQGRTGLLIGDSRGELLETPQSAFYANREEVKGEIKVNADGSVDGLISLEEFGVHKLQWVKIFSAIDEKNRGNLAKILLGHMDPRALLIDYSFRENSDSNAPFLFRSHFKINNFAQRQEHTLQMNTPLIAGAGIKDLLKIDATGRVWPVMVGSPFQEDREVHVIFPEGFHAVSTPRDTYVENETGSLQVVCRPGGSDMVYYSRLIIREGIVPAQKTQSLLAILKALDASYKEQITLEESKK